MKVNLGVMHRRWSWDRELEFEITKIDVMYSPIYLASVHHERNELSHAYCDSLDEAKNWIRGAMDLYESLNRLDLVSFETFDDDDHPDLEKLLDQAEHYKEP